MKTKLKVIPAIIGLMAISIPVYADLSVDVQVGTSTDVSINTKDVNQDDALTYDVKVYDSTGKIVEGFDINFPQGDNGVVGQSFSIEVTPSLTVAPDVYTLQIMISDGDKSLNVPNITLNVLPMNRLTTEIVSHDCPLSWNPSSVTDAYLQKFPVSIDCSDKDLKNFGSSDNPFDLAKNSSLIFSNNNLGALPAFKYGEGLSELDIKNNSISDISSLSSIPFISRLNISENPIDDLEPLSNVKVNSLFVSPDYDYSKKIPSNSPICFGINEGTVNLEGERNFYTNICEAPTGKEKEALVVKFFNNHCGTSVKTSNIEDLESLTSIKCFDESVEALDFPPVLTKIDGTLDFYMPNLHDLSGLERLESVPDGGHVYFHFGNSLETVVPFGKNFKAGTVYLNNSPNLKDISSLTAMKNGSIILPSKRIRLDKRIPGDSDTCQTVASGGNDVNLKLLSGSGSDAYEYAMCAPETGADLSMWTTGRFLNEHCKGYPPFPYFSKNHYSDSNINCGLVNYLSFEDLLESPYLEEVGGFRFSKVINSEGKHFGDEGFDNLSLFSGIKKYNNYLDFSQNNLKNINFLSNLTSANGSLYLNNNKELTDISALSSLTDISPEFSLIVRNTSITDFSPLSNLSGKMKTLNIADISNINNLSGLENLEPKIIVANQTSVEERLSGETAFCNNFASGDVNLANCSMEYYDICDESGVGSIAPLVKYLNENTSFYSKSLSKSIIFSGDYRIHKGSEIEFDEPWFDHVHKLVFSRVEGEPFLTSESTSPFKYIKSLNYFDIYRTNFNTEALNNFSNISDVNGDFHFYIEKDTHVSDLSFFSGLKSIKDRLLIFGRDKSNELESLHGLENLENVGFIDLQNLFPKLQDISVLNNVTSINKINLPHIDYGVKLNADSTICNGLFEGTISGNAYYSDACNVKENYEDNYALVKWFGKSDFNTHGATINVLNNLNANVVLNSPYSDDYQFKDGIPLNAQNLSLKFMKVSDDDWLKDNVFEPVSKATVLRNLNFDNIPLTDNTLFNGFGNMEALYGSLSLNFNGNSSEDSISDINFPNLKTIDVDLHIGNRENVTKLKFPLLNKVRNIYVENVPLETLDLSSLESVGGTFVLHPKDGTLKNLEGIKSLSKVSNKFNFLGEPATDFVKLETSSPFCKALMDPNKPIELGEKGYSTLCKLTDEQQDYDKLINYFNTACESSLKIPSKQEIETNIIGICGNAIIPDDTLKPLFENLKHLKYVDISETDSEKFDLSLYSNLSYVDHFYFNNVFFDDQQMSSFSKLTKSYNLTVTNNPKVTNLDFLSNLKNLHSLNIKGDQNIDDISGISNLEKIDTFILENTKGGNNTLSRDGFKKKLPYDSIVCNKYRNNKPITVGGLSYKICEPNPNDEYEKKEFLFAKIYHEDLKRPLNEDRIYPGYLEKLNLSFYNNASQDLLDTLPVFMTKHSGNIDLSNVTGLTSFPNFMSSMETIGRLDFSSTPNLSDANNLSNLTEIEYILGDDTNISSDALKSGLANLTRIGGISISGDNIVDLNWIPLAVLQNNDDNNLRSLNLRNNKNLSDISALSNMKGKWFKGKDIDIRGTAISDVSPLNDVLMSLGGWGKHGVLQADNKEFNVKLSAYSQICHDSFFRGVSREYICDIAPVFKGYDIGTQELSQNNEFIVVPGETKTFDIVFDQDIEDDGFKLVDSDGENALNLTYTINGHVMTVTVPANSAELKKSYNLSVPRIGLKNLVNFTIYNEVPKYKFVINDNDSVPPFYPEFKFTTSDGDYSADPDEVYLTYSEGTEAPVDGLSFDGDVSTHDSSLTSQGEYILSTVHASINGFDVYNQSGDNGFDGTISIYEFTAHKPEVLIKDIDMSEINKDQWVHIDK